MRRKFVGRVLTGVAVLLVGGLTVPASPASADTVIATIVVGINPGPVAINSAGTFAYVANRGSDMEVCCGTVSKIDLATDTVVATIPVDGKPQNLILNSAGTFAYVVAHVRSATYPDTLTRLFKIDLATDTVVSSISGFGEIGGLVLNPAGTFAYVTSTDADWKLVSAGTAFDYSTGTAVSLSKIDLATNTVVGKIALGTTGYLNLPLAAAIDSAGTFAYFIYNWAKRSMVKVELATDTVVATFSVVGNGARLAVNSASTFAYVTNYSGTVSKINLKTGTVDATFKVGDWPRSVAVNPAGTFAYITHDGYKRLVANGFVSKVDLATDTVVATFSVGINPEGVAVNPAGTFAYVTNAKSGTVSKIRLNSAVPVLTTTKSVSAKMVATYAELTVSKGAAISMRVAPLSAKVCKVSGTILKFLKAGSCKVTVTVKPKIGKSNSKTVTLTVTM
jgi:YVTN family beta-propeller protein